jgi:hypothetical protein
VSGTIDHGGGRPPFTDGSGRQADQIPVDESSIKARLRVLFGQDGLPRFTPRLWVATTCRAVQTCIVCRTSIRVGESQFEVVMPGGVVLFLHRRCFEIWLQQAAYDATSSSRLAD